MIGLFGNVSQVFKSAKNLQKVNIDNGALKIQYKLTTTALVVATIIITANNYIGDPIQCVQSSGAIDVNVLNTYCFFIALAFKMIYYEGLTKNVSQVFKSVIKVKKVNIDNGALKIQYKLTTFALVIATIIVTANNYIGDPMQCVQSSGAIDKKVLNTYCYFIGTHSVNNNESAYPFYGIGPQEEYTTTRHLYYQWVPFYLTFLAITFYSAHFFWKAYEKGKLKTILVGMEYFRYSVCNTHVDNIPSISERDEQLEILAKYLWKRIQLKVNSNWSIYLFMIELYALVQVAFAYFLTDIFLGGNGAFVNMSLKTSSEVFPTMAKCTFHKYGPTGGLQTHDALCVLALNIVNEKIFYILHFWIPFVLAVAALAVLWRLFGFCLFRNVYFNKVLIRKNNSMKLDEDDKKLVLGTISYWDWIFICYLAGNSDGFVFQELFAALAKCIREEDMLSNDDEDSVMLKGASMKYD